jgi:hypothetical protein
MPPAQQSRSMGEPLRRYHWRLAPGPPVPPTTETERIECAGEQTLAAWSRKVSSSGVRPSFTHEETSMTHFRAAICSGLLAALTGLGACHLAPITATTNTMMARLSGADEVPPVTGEGTGTVETDLNRKTGVLTWTITYAGLTGPVTAAHFHGPASAGEGAGVVVPITGNLVSPIKGQTPLTSAQVTGLVAGRWYVNLHTSAYPEGEVRGQVIAMP